MNQMAPIEAEAATDLAVIAIPEDTALAVFSGEYETTIAPLLVTVARAVEAFKATAPDVTTEDGRKAIASFDYKLARSKTALDKAGAKVNADLKALPKKIDANRRRAWDTIEAWQTEITAPIEAWKTAEKARVDNHVAAIEAIQAKGTNLDGLTADAIMGRMKALDDMAPHGEAREEFAEEYERAQRVTIAALGLAFAARQTHEAQQSELAALRAEKAARDAKDAAEAADREKAEAIRTAQSRAESEATAEIEREKQAAIDAARRETERAEAAEREAAAKAERDALAAKLAEEATERRKLEIAAQERRDADAKAASEKAAADRIAAGVEHRRKINRAVAEAITALIEGAQNELTPGQIVVQAAAKGLIPNLTISY